MLDAALKDVDCADAAAGGAVVEVAAVVVAAVVPAVGPVSPTPVLDGAMVVP